MADLFKSNLDGTSAEDEGLDSEEYKILEDSGVLSPRRKGGRRKSAAGHVVFASSLEEGALSVHLSTHSDVNPRPTARALGNSQNTHDDDSMDVEASKQALESDEDLGWKQAPSKKKKSKPSHEEWEDEDGVTTREDSLQSGTETRRRLLKELSARLHRDQQLQYAQREFEMQRLMMGKGARQKISATQKEEGDDESEEDEDEVDARKGRRKDRPRTVDEATYKPRVYKWKLERKR
jgi:U3 small nucleolar RNA-associated protein 11